MIKSMQDDQLIFMISLPRSGSTLLQKILGGHSDIYTRSEPWLMLHPLYALKTEGIQTRYNAELAVAGVQNFLQELPAEDENYYSSRIRDCYLSLYAPYLNASGKERFLDKTPRYYEIFDELQKTFPRAKFIILYRNPLAVFASILETWVKGNYEKLKNYQGDLYTGVEFLQRDFTAYTNTHVVRYEDLLLNPEDETEALFDFLLLPNQPDCIDYGRHKGERWMYGDPETVYEKNRPDSQHIDAWHKQLLIPEHRKLLLDYLQSLGRLGFEQLGYSFDTAMNAFASSETDELGDYSKEALSLANLLLTENENAQRIQQRNVKLQQEIQANEERWRRAQQPLGDAEAEHQKSPGQIQDLTARIRDLEAQLKSANLQIRSREAQLASRDDQIGIRDAQLQKRDEQISLLAVQLRERDQQIDIRDTRITERDKQINQRDAFLNERDGQISKRDNRVAELTEQVKHTYQQLTNLDDALRQQQAKLAKYETLALESKMKVEESFQQSMQLESRLKQLVGSAEKLTAKRALFSPRHKLNAYRELLRNFVEVRKFMRNRKN